MMRKQFNIEIDCILFDTIKYLAVKKRIPMVTLVTEMIKSYLSKLPKKKQDELFKNVQGLQAYLEED